MGLYYGSFVSFLFCKSLLSVKSLNCFFVNFISLLFIFTLHGLSWFSCQVASQERATACPKVLPSLSLKHTFMINIPQMVSRNNGCWFWCSQSESNNANDIKWVCSSLISVTSIASCFHQIISSAVIRMLLRFGDIKIIAIFHRCLHAGNTKELYLWFHNQIFWLIHSFSKTNYSHQLIKEILSNFFYLCSLHSLLKTLSMFIKRATNKLVIRALRCYNNHKSY